MTIDVYERDSDSLFFRVEFHNLISSHLHAHAAAEPANGPTSHYGNYSIHHAGRGRGISDHRGTVTDGVMTEIT